MSDESEYLGDQADDIAGQDTYEVGYKKPPKGTQFKKGNKRGKGRPRGSRNYKTMANDILNAKTFVKVQGKQQKRTMTEVALMQLAKKAAAGDLKAIDMMLKIKERYEPIEDSEQLKDADIAYEIETLRQYMLMNHGEGTGS